MKNCQAGREPATLLILISHFPDAFSAPQKIYSSYRAANKPKTKRKIQKKEIKKQERLVTNQPLLLKTAFALFLSTVSLQER